MSHAERPNDDLRERLADELTERCLREVLDGERVPDLGGRILAAAKSETDSNVSLVPASQENAMTDPSTNAPLTNSSTESSAESSPRTNAGWKLFAVAACLLLLVGGAVLLPNLQRDNNDLADWQPSEADKKMGKDHDREDAHWKSKRELAEAGQRRDVPESSVPANDNQADVTKEADFIDGIDSHGLTVDSSASIGVRHRLEVEQESGSTTYTVPAPEPTSGDGQLDIVAGGIVTDAATSDLVPGAGVTRRPAIPKPLVPSQPGTSDYRRSGRSSSKSGGEKDLKPGDSPAHRSENGSPATELAAGRSTWSLDEKKRLTHELRDQIAALTTDGRANGRAGKEELGRLTTRLKQLEAGFVDEGRGPGQGGDRYERIVENPFRSVGDHPLSTFSIDVDKASYANVRQYLMQNHTLPPPDAVRIEELVNYFQYDYAGPEPTTDAVPFAARVEVAACPWKPEHRLVRVGIKGKEIVKEERPTSNLVFLLDVSGSMNQPNKLPLLKQGMKLLAEQLEENDRVAIVVYASSEGLALPSTPGYERDKVVGVLDNLRAGGSTAGGAGIQLAYKVAEENFVKGGVNRVILCTDGDFNVGVTSPAALERMAEEKAKETGVFLTVLGFGRGNLNDAMMEKISGKGNGNYFYIDSVKEAQKVLVEELGGTLVTIAKDVKIQIEFNPSQVAEYRLVGYENRMLAKEDFNDDTKDAGEIGAGHTVTAMYEIVPAGETLAEARAAVDELKYQKDAKPTKAAKSGELLTLKLRYKEPDGDVSTKLEFPVSDDDKKFARATPDFKFATSVAGFGMLLRGSQHAGNTTYASILEIAREGVGDDPHGYRKEFLELVERAREVAGE